MKIAGFWSRHDCSFCIMDNGKVNLHLEYERYLREKEPLGDSLKFLFDHYENTDDINHFVTCYEGPRTDTAFDLYPESINRIQEIIKKNNGQLHIFGHHQAHAANAFFSCPYEDALVVTIDGGGWERPGLVTAFTVWEGKGNKITPIHYHPFEDLNLGVCWTDSVRIIFGLNVGYPKGNQAGTVMAMAAMGDPNKFFAAFEDIIRNYRSYDVNKFEELRKQAITEKDKFDLAAGLQLATENVLREVMMPFIKKSKSKNLCLAGGVALNSVAVGKMFTWFSEYIDNIFVTPVPYDGGLCIGAAQYLYYHVLENPRTGTQEILSPYLGEVFSEEQIINTINSFDDTLKFIKSSDEEVVDLLDKQKIIAVFGGGSESGRRALGNRSIIADPRYLSMKDVINENVKHRQWFRPFAPSILKEYVKEYFKLDKDSPYMTAVLEFKDEVKEKVQAVVHFDGTARLQTVEESHNSWYYNFIKKWNEKSGVPIVLNTSFNDSEPICETPEHSIKCFLGTNIDFLYFTDYKILVTKK